MIKLELLQRLEQSLKRAATLSKKRELVAGFDIFISESSSPYMNVAVPSSAQVDWQHSIEEMKNYFNHRQRQARLEYFHELYPNLKAALEKAGFIQEMAAPVMILTKENLSSKNGTATAEYLLLDENEENLKTFLRRQSLAFGGLGDDLSFLDSMRNGLKQGNIMGAALKQDNEIVSGAIIQGGVDGELAGVWTLPSKQKQGLAYTLCHKLLQDYFSRGQNLCWLSAAEEAQKLYANLGFTVAGTQLNMSLTHS